MKRGNFDLRVKFEGMRIADKNFDNFDDLEDTIKEIKTKFMGRK